MRNWVRSYCRRTNVSTEWRQPVTVARHSETNDGFLIVEDEVDDILEFRWWIRAFGDTVEVMKPKSLRKEFAEMSKRMSSQYE